MKVSALRQVLKKLAETQSLLQAKASAVRDIEQLVDFLEPHSELSVKQFLTRLERALNDADGGIATPSKPAIRKTPANAEAVAQHVAALKAAGNDPVQFQAALSGLETAPDIKLKELAAITQEFTGDPSAIRSRKVALSAIREKHRQHRVSADRLKKTKGIF